MRNTNNLENGNIRTWIFSVTQGGSCVGTVSLRCTKALALQLCESFAKTFIQKHISNAFDGDIRFEAYRNTMYCIVSIDNEKLQDFCFRLEPVVK